MRVRSPKDDASLVTVVFSTFSFMIRSRERKGAVSPMEAAEHLPAVVTKSSEPRAGTEMDGLNGSTKMGMMNKGTKINGRDGSPNLEISGHPVLEGSTKLRN